VEWLVDTLASVESVVAAVDFAIDFVGTGRMVAVVVVVVVVLVDVVGTIVVGNMVLVVADFVETELVAIEL
jgi:hypothetical protein